jgi:hypothetical protein
MNFLWGRYGEQLTCFQAFAVFCVSCVIFWVVLRRMVFNSRRFGTLCLFHLHRRVDATIHLTLTTMIAINPHYLLQQTQPLNPSLPKGLRQYVPVCHITKFYHHSFRIHAPMKMEQVQCSETSAIKHHTSENNPKGYTRHQLTYLSCVYCSFELSWISHFNA